MEFIASLVYEVKMTGTGREFFEEHLIWLVAENDQEALKLAKQSGEAENEVLDTASEGFQLWKFVDVRYLFPVLKPQERKPFLTRTLNSSEFNYSLPLGQELSYQ